MRTAEVFEVLADKRGLTLETKMSGEDFHIDADPEDSQEPGLKRDQVYGVRRDNRRSPASTLRYRIVDADSTLSASWKRAQFF